MDSPQAEPSASPQLRIVFRLNPAFRGPSQTDSASPSAVAVREVYEGVDVDAYRARYGKEEGERRFFLENRPISTLTSADLPSTITPAPPRPSPGQTEAVARLLADLISRTTSR